MAALDAVALDVAGTKLTVPQAADTYNLPRSVSVTGAVSASGDVSGGGTSLSASATHQVNVANPHSVTALQVGAEPVNANIQAHIGAATNPHSVTAFQTGAVPNTSLNAPNGVATTDANNEVVQLASGAGAALVGAYLKQDGTWSIPAGGGDMLAATYDPTAKAGDSFAMDNMAEGALTKVLTSTERTNIASGVTHSIDVNNPHSVTKVQVGLGNVDNTSDINKPVSTTQQTALDLKATLGEVVSFSGVVIPAIDFALPIPAANIVDHDFFDNTQDAAWIDQCADKSWELEHIASGKQYYPSGASYANDAAALAANPSIVNGDVYYTGSVFNEYGVGTTTRAGSRKFPMRGFVTAEAARVIIWDITSGSTEMWRVRTVTGASSIATDGGHIAIGSSAGVYYEDYPADKIDLAVSYSTTTSPAIVNSTVNSVAITYLPDAPLDDYGMRVPTIAVGTAAKGSVIQHDGTVTTFGSDANPVGHLVFTVDGESIVSSLSNYTNIRYYRTRDGLYLFEVYISTIPTTLKATNKRIVAHGRVVSSSLGVELWVYNPTNPANGMVAYLTNTYNTGWMVGDIRRCFLTNSADGTTIFTGGAGGAITNGTTFFDASVKTGVLTATSNGGLIVSQVGGMKVYSGFSAANYLSEATSPDFANIGTGDFFMCAWVNVTAITSYSYALKISDPTNSTASNVILGTNNSGLLFTRFGASSLPHTSAISAGQWNMLAAWRKNNVLYIALNGSVFGTTVASNDDVSPVLNINGLGVGASPFNGANPQSGSLSLVRISATAPTPEQIKYMYETERKLFEPNAQALLPHSTSSAVVDLKPDPKSGMFVVENGAAAKGSSSNFTAVFKDLVRVDSAATSATIATPVTTLSGNRVLAPAVDIGSELAAQVKPDKHSVMVYYTGTASLEYRAPMGMKIISAVAITTGVHIDLSVAANDKFDGFRYSTVVANGTKYQITLEAV